jgi:hypothetical protein
MNKYLLLTLAVIVIALAVYYVWPRDKEAKSNTFSWVSTLRRYERNLRRYERKRPLRLFEHSEYNGRSLLLRISGEYDLNDYNFDNKISSLFVPSGMRVTLYTDKSKRLQLRVQGPLNITNLRDVSYNLEGNVWVKYDDRDQGSRITMIKIENLEGDTQPAMNVFFDDKKGRLCVKNIITHARLKGKVPHCS